MCRPAPAALLILSLVALAGCTADPAAAPTATPTATAEEPHPDSTPAPEPTLLPIGGFGEDETVLYELADQSGSVSAGPFTTTAATLNTYLTCVGTGEITVALDDAAGATMMSRTGPCEPTAPIRDANGIGPFENVTVAVTADPRVRWNLAVTTQDLAAEAE